MGQQSATIAGQGQALITAGVEKARLLTEVGRVIDEQAAFEKQAGASSDRGGAMTPASEHPSTGLHRMNGLSGGEGLSPDCFKMRLAPY